MSDYNIKDILRRIDKVEDKVEGIEEKVNQQAIEDADLKGELKSLRSEFAILKVDIIEQMSRFTFNLWKLIFVLLAVILALVGVKEIPKLW